jgi:hypothetical protein
MNGQREPQRVLQRWQTCVVHSISVDTPFEHVSVTLCMQC